MWVMGFSKVNCKNCYACLRACPVHAIRVKNDQAQIMKDRCIVCGRCFRACPQNAKLIRSEIDMVKHYISGRKKVVASIAPSFASIFGKYSNKIPKALRLLGFDYVEETASIVDPIINEYEKYANLDDHKTYITSFCPSVNKLIEKYYKDFTDNIIPVASPAIFHARVLKNIYGKDTKVIFIGPCLAKKTDGHDDESIDIVLTFEELQNWLKEKNIDLETIGEEPFDYVSKEKRLLPIIGGPTKHIEENNPKKSIIQVDGIDDCIKILDELKKGKLKNSLIDMNSCRHSCVNGSGMPHDNITCYERKENLKQYAKRANQEKNQYNPKINDIISQVSIKKNFASKEILLKQPTEEELREIMKSMGKHDKNDELNCGSCGYHTCKEKAIAVYNDMAEVNMCLPFMRERAENLTNIIFDMTPNMIAIINKNLEIVQLNPAAEKFFDITNKKAIGLPILMFLDENKFENIKKNKVNTYKEKVVLEYNQSTIIQSIIWLEKNQVMLWIADDITKDEKLQQSIQNMKIDAINMAQKVINKQMTVAQEIASLLGETTAETKVTLTQLKNLIQEDNSKQ